ncbi:MAG: DUF4279 domain-containing protein [Rhodospirillales bacterium]|nr:MAG: DUF4279 domain-containing protein [Rhodospirillales bacterium]
MDQGSVCIRFRHPTRALTFLSDALGLTPLRTWTVGAPRQTPVGTPLSGVYKDSFWTSSADFEPADGFKAPLAAALERLSRRSDVVHDLLSTGGRLEVYVQLVGWINNGDSVDTALLKTMVDLGATFEVEVFPE